MNSKLIILADIEKDNSSLFSFSIQFALITRLEIVILYQHIPVIPSTISSTERTKLIKSSAAAARRKIEKLSRSFISKGLKTKISITRNDLDKEISERYIKEDILVLSLNERNSIFKKFLPVKTAIPVINNLSNTIICIPEGEKDVDFFKWKVAVQRSNPLDVHELNRILKLTQDGASEIRFFSVIDEQDAQNEVTAYLKELTDYFHNDNDIKAGFDILEGKDVFDSIKNLMQNYPNEFLVLQKGSRLLTDKIFRKFLITAIVKDAKIPLIVIG